VKRVMVDEVPEVGSCFAPEPHEAHHLIRVRRIERGETVEVLDGRGGLARAEVVWVSKRTLELRVTDHPGEIRESSLRLTLAVAIPAQLSTVDGVLPGIAQLGVDRVFLVPTAFGGRIKKDRERYLGRLVSIAANALKQCGRTRLPELVIAPDLETLAAHMGEQNDHNILFHPGPSEADPEPGLASLGLAIGPEGGFSDDEVALLCAHGFRRRGLGPRILEMPTAMIGACFWAQERFGDLA